MLNFIINVFLKIMTIVWDIEYAFEMHRKIRRGEVPERYLVFDQNGAHIQYVYR